MGESIIKELTLCRHAKSTWKYETEDLYRPLNKRGISNASTMAKGWRGDTPDLILCSPAVRAYSTALAYVYENHWPIAILSLRKELFEAGIDAMLSLISDSHTLNRVWVFSHNPRINLLVQFITGNKIDNIVTGARVRIEFDIKQWREIEYAKGRLIDIVAP